MWPFSSLRRWLFSRPLSEQVAIESARLRDELQEKRLADARQLISQMRWARPTHVRELPYRRPAASPSPSPAAPSSPDDWSTSVLNPVSPVGLILNPASPLNLSGAGPLSSPTEAPAPSCSPASSDSASSPSCGGDFSTGGSF
jgi:hypothetical protein